MPWKNWSAERVGVALVLLAALGFSLKPFLMPQPRRPLRDFRHLTDGSGV